MHTPCGGLQALHWQVKQWRMRGAVGWAGEQAQRIVLGGGYPNAVVGECKRTLFLGGVVLGRCAWGPCWDPYFQPHRHQGKRLKHLNSPLHPF